MKYILMYVTLVAFLLTTNEVFAQCSFTPTLTTNIANPSLVCTQSTNTITTETGMTGYIWTIVMPDGTTNTINNSAITSQVNMQWPLPGNYTFTVAYTKNGCTASSAPLTITVLQSPAANIYPTVPPIPLVCSGVPQALSTDTGFTNYEWSVPPRPGVPAGTFPTATITGQNTSAASFTWSFSMSQSATAQVRYLDPSKNGCYSIGTKQILVSPSPGPPQVNGNTVGCINESIDYGVMNYNQYFTYTWEAIGGTVTPGANGHASVNWTSLGIQSLSVKISSGGCASLPTIIPVTVKEKPAVTNITSPGDPCVNTNGTYTAVGTFPAGTNFYWSFAINAATIVGAANQQSITLQWKNGGPNKLSVYVVTPGCNGNTLEKTVNVKGLAISSNNLSSHGACFGPGNVFTVQPGLSNYSWSVAPQGGPNGAIVVSTGNQATVEFTTSNFYNITVTAGVAGETIDGCAAPVSITRTVLVTSRIAAPTISAPTVPMCTSTRTAYYFSASSPAAQSYEWEIPPGVEYSHIQGSSAFVIWGASGSQTIKVKSLDTYSCPSDWAEFAYNINATPSAKVSRDGNVLAPNADVYICPGIAATLSMPNSGANVEYKWVRSPDGTVNTTNSWTTAQPGNYYTTATNTVSGCSSESDWFFIRNYWDTSPPPVAIIDIQCNSMKLTANVTPPAGHTYTYEWKNSLGQTVGTTKDLATTAPGTFTVTVNDITTGCSKSSLPYSTGPNFKVQPSGVVTSPGGTIVSTGSTTASLTVCGVVATLDAEMPPPDGTLTYTWYQQTTGQVMSQSRTYTALSNGVYYVRVFSLYGTCNATSKYITVTINPNPLTTLTSPGPVVQCASTTLSLVSHPAGYTYEWTTGSTVVGTNYNVTLTVPDGAAPSTALYKVKVTNTATQCSGTSNEVSVTLNANPSALLNKTTPVVQCSGTVSLYPLDHPSTFTYAWTDENNVAVGSNYQLDRTNLANTTNTHSYKVKITNPVTGCFSNSIAIPVTFNPLPDSTLSLAGASTSACGSYVLSVQNPAGGQTYEWTKGGAPYGTNASTVTFSNSTTTTPASDNFRLKVTNTTTNCSSRSDIKNITINPVPSSSISKPNGSWACFPTAVRLVGAGEGTFEWWQGSINTHSSLPEYFAGIAADYKLLVTNVYGCSKASDTARVIIRPKPNVTIAYNGPAAICPTGDSFRLTGSGATTYDWYRRTPNPGYLASGPTYDVTTLGTYYAIGKGANTCTSDPSVDVVVGEKAKAGVPMILLGGLSCGKITLSTKPAGMYQWSTGATTSSIQITTPGTYTLRVKAGDNSNCWSDLASVTIASMPAASVTIQATGNLCSNPQVSLLAKTANGTSPTYSWSNGATTASISVSTPGTYTCTVTFSGGCVRSASATVATPPPGCQYTIMEAPAEVTVTSYRNIDHTDVNNDPLLLNTFVSPNPASVEIDVTTPAQSNSRKVSLVSMHGVTVHVTEIAPGKTSSNIPVNTLAGGMYVLIIESENTVERHKVLVQH